ncbi:AsnC family transcriptional regulator [Arthrobacter sp. Rue61a]|jgi:Lrp/AsnC family transcriptional regulator for asnA, asnC and gidA|uniref:Transcriptional regulator, AsnC family n=1 Tax=Paenarthrobacter aurescens (strain TC1) TaxID=290340 RepID=A1R336_PAEAT|nr:MULTISPECIES: AsnC family transcriptional regulator [Micrococcaceae]ABM07056.1 transcriptional regulator, AsnC family [Paenarthrobacter aurescens TC1]AFR27733.1 transcriptional regulator, AsnC family [Arthrobacter sp. Rue61a]
MVVFDALERQIVAALQQDPRCPWRKMAAVLGEAERTVARRGSLLLESGSVAVVGIRPRPAVVLVEMRCMPGTVRAASNALAQRADTTFVYTTTGTGDCVAEILTEPSRMGDVLSDELPSTIGLRDSTSYPVLRYFRTIRGWRPEVLAPDKAEALRSDLTKDSGILVPLQDLSRQDNELIDALCADGRASFEALGRRVGVSEATARRRSEWLLANNHIQLRAIVEPAAFGLGVEALLWIRASPQHVERVGRSLAELPTVRYAAAIAGDYQIVADVTVEDMSSLYRFITDSEWAQEATGVDVSILLDARKRGGRIMRSSS